MSACLLSPAVLIKRGLTCTATTRFSPRPMGVPTAPHHPSNQRNSSAFTYRIAAASSPKRAPPRQPKAGQDYWNYALTQNNTSPPYLASRKRDSGEDSFFATTIGGSKHHVAFGVADGVGGWQDSGVDPSLYSQALAGLMAGSAREYEGQGNGKPLRPQGLLQTAYDAVMANPRIQAGGCTASLAVLDEEGNMEAANLGDSGFLVLSPGKVAHRSMPQTHAFNTPYQLSKVPPKMQQQYAIFGGSTYFSETPAQADVTSCALKHGDIVLFATDGVWDNLSAQDTLRIVTRIMAEGGYWFKSHNFAEAETMLNESLVRNLPTEEAEDDQESLLPGQLARALMREAKVAGLDRKRNGPFAKEVKMRYPNEAWEGGKPDDIAVVACVAVQDGSVKAKL